MMKRTLWVEGSSLISRMDYWEETAELDVLFQKNGALYRYQGISLSDFGHMAAGESIGKAFVAVTEHNQNYERLA